MTLYSFTIPSNNLEDDAGVWMYLGADGTVEVDVMLKVFKEGGLSDAEELMQAGMDNGLISEKVEIVEIPQENWMANCEAVQQPVQSKRFSVIPVMDESKREPAENNIYILSGLGFGTGHHETTFQCLEHLQSDLINQINPKDIIDVGAGSGILAIACKKIWQESNVVATEIDPLALENAEINLKLNHLEDNISLYNTTFPSEFKQYDLIIANLFSSVLISLESDFRSHIKNSGLLLVSGIKGEQILEIEEAFKSWKIIAKTEINNWYAVLFSPNI